MIKFKILGQVARIYQLFGLYNGDTGGQVITIKLSTIEVSLTVTFPNDAYLMRVLITARVKQCSYR